LVEQRIRKMQLRIIDHISCVVHESNSLILRNPIVCPRLKQIYSMHQKVHHGPGEK